ncbi:hypothetical protein CLOP_g21709 [Closterium sp. NIES-67]|nr:hypothetical protein CLOP_g21709 [Closterium sp. NIES-67]
MPSAGRPRLVTERVRHGIVRSITSDETEIYAHVVKIVEKQHGITLHPKTLRNALNGSGLVAIKHPKKPRHSRKNKRDRLEWARAYADWTVDD